MNGDMSAVPLTALTAESRNLLSERLNPRKLLPIILPDNLARHRDWRGLASLVPISTEVAANINECQDKTGKVLDIWMKRKDGTAVVSRLIDMLQLLDRFDVCEDLLELSRDNRFIINCNFIYRRIDEPEFKATKNQVAVAVSESDHNIITYDDKLFGVPQWYHAFVLFAREDRVFVDELLTRMRNEGFKLCTEEELLPGHSTQFEPVSRLIAERCRYIVLIYSPDFLRSSAITFYMNLAQADSINKKQSKIIPVMYRECVLPSNLAYYHNLRYPHPHMLDHFPMPYNFWERLSYSLRIVDPPRLNNASASFSSMSIAEITTALTNGDPQMNGFLDTLALPDVPRQTSSLQDLRPPEDTPNSYETISLHDRSQHDQDKKKKSGAFSKIMNTLRARKHKNELFLNN